MTKPIYSEDEREKAAYDIIRERHGRGYADGYWGKEDRKLVLENTEHIEARCALTRLIALAEKTEGEARALVEVLSCRLGYGKVRKLREEQAAAPEPAKPTQDESLKRPTRVSPYWNPEIARDVWLYRQDEADAYIAQLEATIAAQKEEIAKLFGANTRVERDNNLLSEALYEISESARIRTIPLPQSRRMR